MVIFIPNVGRTTCSNIHVQGVGMLFTGRKTLKHDFLKKYSPPPTHTLFRSSPPIISKSHMKGIPLCQIYLGSLTQTWIHEYLKIYRDLFLPQKHTEHHERNQRG